MNGSTYTGEFANDCEHGYGAISYPDGSKFEGRFRFGRRDGLGVLIDPTGTSAVRRVYRDKEPLNVEKPLKNIELDDDRETGEGGWCSVGVSSWNQCWCEVLLCLVGCMNTSVWV